MTEGISNRRVKIDLNISLPQSTIDMIFYVINMITFLLCAVSMYYHQDYDGASNELTLATLYEYSKRSKYPKKKQNLVKLFRWVRRIILLGCIFGICLIVKKGIWILVILEIWLIIQSIVILINCFFQPDHNFTKYEQYWLTSVAVFLVLQRFPLGLFSNDFVVWQKQLPEGTAIGIQSILWLIQIFMLFSAGLLAFNGFCKKKQVIHRIDYERFAWNISNWYIKQVDRNKFLKYLLPFILLADAVFYLIKKAVLFCIAMFNELLPSINGVIQRQVNTLDTQVIRLAFRMAIVCSLSMMYGYMELKGIFAESTKNVFSYFATVIVIPIVIEGILGLRERIKEQTKTEWHEESFKELMDKVIKPEKQKEICEAVLETEIRDAENKT